MYVTTQMNQKTCYVKKPGTDYILCNYIYMKFPEKENLQRQKAEQWLPMAEDCKLACDLIGVIKMF